MEGMSGFWGQSDFISRTVGLLLLAMSVASCAISRGVPQAWPCSLNSAARIRPSAR